MLGGIEAIALGGNKFKLGGFALGEQLFCRGKGGEQLPGIQLCLGLVAQCFAVVGGCFAPNLCNFKCGILIAQIACEQGGAFGYLGVAGLACLLGVVAQRQVKLAAVSGELGGQQ